MTLSFLLIDKFSFRVAQKMIGMGFRRVSALRGGWAAWEKAGYPTEPKKR